MTRNQIDWEHDYLLSPNAYPINDNEAHSTYDQFIQLRDTLIFSWKYYNDKAGCKLIVWSKEDWKTTTNTIEVMWKNWFKWTFNPTYATDPDNQVILESEWPYVSWLARSTNPEDQPWINRFGVRAFRIEQDWNYLVLHKEEIGSDDNPIPSTVKQVHCYVNVYRQKPDWTYNELNNPTYEIAVFDWKIDYTKTFTGSISWTCHGEWWWSVTGTCTVPITLTLWDLYTKMTSFGYNQRNLKKWDILVLFCEDQDKNELTYQDNWSNYIEILYLDATLHSN